MCVPPAMKNGRSGRCVTNELRERPGFRATIASTCAASSATYVSPLPTPKGTSSVAFISRDQILSAGVPSAYSISAIVPSAVLLRFSNPEPMHSDGMLAMLVSVIAPGSRYVPRSCASV